jgi:hypothetical protein
LVDSFAKRRYNTYLNNKGYKMDLLKLCREAGNDMRADMGGECDDSMAYEIANCLLEDPKVLAAAKKMFPGKSRSILQEILADRI